jgi:hypothetical protein
MASALSSLANATLTLTVPTDGTVTDADTGNVLPATTTQTYSLFIRTGAPALEELPGINSAVTIYEGYCVSPQALSAVVLEGTFGVLDFAGRGSFECKVLQTRYDYGSTGLLGAALQGALGDKIRLAQLRAL